MKRVISKGRITVLGILLGMVIMVAPLANTVYAAEAPLVTMGNSDHNGRPEIDSRPARAEALAQHMERYRDWVMKNPVKTNNENPVDVVRAAAELLGFDLARDTISLESQSPSQAAVQVFHNGYKYSVNLDRSPEGLWMISSAIS